MSGIVRFLLSGLAVLLTSYLLPGVALKNFWYALLVAAVLSLANMILKPLLVILTIPVTIVTFGLFLLVINAFIIMLVDYIVPGFEVRDFWWALAFSLILSIFNSMFSDISREDRGKRNKMIS
jgi:putative membrane protein